MSAPAEAAVLPGADSLRGAADRLAGQVHRTPLQRSEWLSERAGFEVRLKLECWQRTGSFKLRGALNAVAARVERGLSGPLTTASAGNHGLALAHAARVHGREAVIFVPAAAPDTKKRRIRRAGADLREVPGIYDDAAAAARSFAEAEGADLLHPFDDPDVVAGQATVTGEVLEDWPEVREIVVPVGGGGLAAGAGAATRAIGSSARVRGVQSDATRAMWDAFEAGAVVATETRPTICDGLAGETEASAYRRARAALHDLRLVPEPSVVRAVRELFREEAVVAEGSAAVGIAALLEGVLHLSGPIAVVVSGGNIDGDRLGEILAGPVDS